MNALPTPRQQVAAALARELDKLPGTWTVSALPLDNNRNLRVQILDCVRNEATQIIRDWGHEPVCISVLPRVVAHNPVEAACVWEIALPRDQVPVPDRTIRGELASPAKSSSEVQQILKHLGMK